VRNGSITITLPTCDRVRPRGPVAIRPGDFVSVPGVVARPGCPRGPGKAVRSRRDPVTVNRGRNPQVPTEPATVGKARGVGRSEEPGDLPGPPIRNRSSREDPGRWSHRSSSSAAPAAGEPLPSNGLALGRARLVATAERADETWRSASRVIAAERPRTGRRSRSPLISFRAWRSSRATCDGIVRRLSDAPGLRIDCLRGDLTTRSR